MPKAGSTRPHRNVVTTRGTEAAERAARSHEWPTGPGASWIVGNSALRCEFTQAVDPEAGLGFGLMPRRRGSTPEEHRALLRARGRIGAKEGEVASVMGGTGEG